MTRDEIIRMARDACYDLRSDAGTVAYVFTYWQLERFASLVAAAEREECAKIAEGFGPSRPIIHERPSTIVYGRWEGEQAASSSIAMAIRSLGEQK